MWVGAQVRLAKTINVIKMHLKEHSGHLADVGTALMYLGEAGPDGLEASNIFVSISPSLAHGTEESQGSQGSSLPVWRCWGRIYGSAARWEPVLTAPTSREGLQVECVAADTRIWPLSAVHEWGEPIWEYRAIQTGSELHFISLEWVRR